MPQDFSWIYKHNVLIYPEAVVYMCFVKKVFFKILETSTCAGVFFNKVSGLRPPSYDSLKKKLRRWYFPVNFVKLLRTPT